MPEDTGRAPPQGVLIDLTDLDHVIRHQTMAAPNQFQSRLGLADAALSGNQKSLSIDIDQDPMDAGGRGQLQVQIIDQFRGELAGRRAGPQKGNIVPVGRLQKRILRLKAPAENHRRDIV